ncbi:MAG: energy transducer TonB [bacterium]
MYKKIIFSSLIALSVTACAAVPAIPGVSKSPLPNSGYSSYKGDMAAEYVSSVRIEAPSACFLPDHQTGRPTRHHRGSIIDQPILRHKVAQKVPPMPRANRNFYCAAFSYTVGRDGHVVDIETLYNSHPNIGGIDFAKEARKSLKQWRYDPGMVDKAPQEFTGLSTVFYYSFE